MITVGTNTASQGGRDILPAISAAAIDLATPINLQPSPLPSVGELGTPPPTPEATPLQWSNCTTPMPRLESMCHYVHAFVLPL